MTLSASRALLGLVALFLAIAPATVTPLSCLNEEGNPVDWFVILKHSGQIDSYLYADSTSGSGGFQESSLDLNSGAVHLTLSASLQEQAFMYNDQAPTNVDGVSGTSTTFGHTKGAVGIANDGSNGFWLIHSAPKAFGVDDDGSLLDYPSNAIKYGQSFLCISLDAPNLNKLGDVFALNRPQLFNVPDSFTAATANAMPKLTSVVSQKTWVKDGKSKIVLLSSVGGQQFKVFAKNKLWGKDLYALVASEYGADVWAETWQNNQKDLGHYCTKNGHAHNVYNIKEYTVAGYTMHQKLDHTKLAIVPDDDILCIGDINRQSSQFNRGGGTACFENKVLVAQIKQKVHAYGEADHLARGQCEEAEEDDDREL